jgi:hypothetical protein
VFPSRLTPVIAWVDSASLQAALRKFGMFPLDVENELLYNSSTLTDNSINGDPLMAKLEELVTPTVLLDEIKAGAMKQEIVKKYKASEQELAMMLLPLYRQGALTKEEFNDFFKGSPLRNAEAGAEVVAPKPEDEPPSEILKSLSKIFGRKSEEAKQPAAEEVPPPSPVAEPEEVEAVAAEVVSEVVDKPAPEIDFETAGQPAPDTAVHAEPETVPDETPETVDDSEVEEESATAEERASTAPAAEPPAELEAEVVEDYSEEDSTSMDSAGISGLLNSIFAKLNSIDKRLEAIEKKVLNE